MRNKLTAGLLFVVAACGESPPDRSAVVDTTMPKGVGPIYLADNYLAADAAADASAAAIDAAAEAVGEAAAYDAMVPPPSYDQLYGSSDYDAMADAVTDAAEEAAAAAEDAAEYYDE